MIIAVMILSLPAERLLGGENPISPPVLAPPSALTPIDTKTLPVTSPALQPNNPELPKGTSQATEKSSTRVEEIKPTLFYLPDKDGRLQAVLDFGYEDFIELYKLKQQLEQKADRPRYTLDKLTAKGKAEDNRAEMIIHLQIALHDADWVRVPLRLDQGLLLQPAEYKGRGEMIVQYLGGSEGYVAWLRGPSDAPHEIEMQLMTPLATVGGEHKLKLQMPRATISEMKLIVAEKPVVIQASEGVTVIPSVVDASGDTEITARGLGGDFELSWRKGGEANPQSSPILEVGGSILARLDDRGISCEAALTVRSYGAPFDRFAVRLPEGADLIPLSNAGYSAALLEDSQKLSRGGRLVEVRLPKKVLGPIEVRLSCRRQMEAKDPPDWLELSGFEVLGAVRQFGVLAAATSGDWQILWGANRGVRQIDRLPENLRVSGVAEGFEYFSQPFSLQVRLNPRRTRVNVEPEYLLFVDRDRVRLEGKLAFSIHGARARAIRISMPGWQVDRIEPENLFAAEGITSDDNGTITVPLAEPASGTIELHLKAQQSLATGTNSISVGLPQPEDAASVSATVAVSPADNVELMPDSKAILGLVRQQSSSLPLKLPERRQEPLFFRSEGKAAVFAAEMHVHARRIVVDATDRVQLDEHSVQIEQKLAYTIAFEAVDHLLLDVPQSLADTASMEFARDGKPLVAKAVGLGEDAGVPAGMTRLRIALPESCLGRCAITARYVLPLPPLQAVKPVTMPVALVVPAEGEMESNALLLASSPGIKAFPLGKTWQLVEKEIARLGRPTPQNYKAAGRIERIDLQIGKEESSSANATVIDRAWIQTWLTAGARQDRAVFQLLTNQNELTLKMPPGAVLSQMIVLLDRKRIEVQSKESDRLSIPLSGNGELRRYVVEIIYHFDDSSPKQGRLDLTFPQIGPGAWSRRLYWQLILPQNEHVLADPRGFVNEYRWGFMGYFWGRQPLLSQEELETWVGATPRTAPTDGLNVYLFSTLGSIEGAKAWTAGRAWIVLCSSGAALLFGLLLIYWPSFRHPVTLLAVAFALMSLGMIFPEPTIMLAQTSSIGLILALITGIFVRLFPRHRRGVLESVVKKMEIPSTKSPRVLPASGVTVSSTQNMSPPPE